MLVEPREAHSRWSTFRLLPAKPRQIDLTTTAADGPTFLRTYGIYSLGDDELTYCVAPPGQPRPAGFATAKRDGNTLVVLRRVPFLVPLSEVSYTEIVPFTTDAVPAVPQDGRARQVPSD
ncbi:MAG TPA: hypothetical protein VKA46_34090 [Gemmataceae bacterium]|nr:hypothetical protein [Gemmataceae bacterium]